jgi:carboxypeptidase Q
MPTRSLLTLALLAALAPPVSVAEEAVDLEMVTRIRDEGFTNSKVMDTVGYLTDVIGPRVTGSPQMREANDWTRQRLESWGLVNAHLEGWTFGRGWSLERSVVQMVKPTPATLVAVPRAFTPGTDGPRRGKVVKVKIESEADAEKYRGQLAGRIVLLGDPRDTANPEKPQFTRYTDQELDSLAHFDVTPTRRGPVDREALARRMRLQRVLRPFFVAEKALATIEVSPTDAGVVLVGRGGSWVKDEDPGVPALVMAAEQYNRLARLVDREVDVELELDIRSRFHDEDPTAYNTVAEIPGTDKRGEIVMLGAHLDSWHAGTGATDNAAGSAVAMEAVRILQALDVKPRRTIRIALWSGEEEGLLGSKAYVTEHLGARAGGPPDPRERDLPSFLRRDPTGPVTTKPDYARLSAYFNVDNGTGKIRGIYAERNAAVAPIFEAWLRPLHDLGATTVTLRHTGGTDHLSFDAVGLPAFQFIQDEADYETRTHHTNLDVYDRLQKTDLMQAAVVLATFVYDAATRPERMPRRPLMRDVPPSPLPDVSTSTTTEPNP